MKRPIHRLLPRLVLIGLALAAPSALAADVASDLDKLFSAAYPADGPGAAVLVEQNGKPLLRKAYGLADLELGVPLAPDSIFRIGSITKQFTSVLVMQLVQEGKLAENDPITKFFPDFPPAQGQGVTVRHLMTHTSGIPSYTDLAEWLPRIREDLSVQQILDFTKDKPRDFPPGTQWKYSNTGYIVLGAILEKVEGKPYAQIVKDRIFKPLGMTSSSYGEEARIILRRAKGYGGSAGSYQNAPYLSMTQPFAAGSLLSTVDDLARWNAALYGESVLAAPYRDRLWQPALLADGRNTHYSYGWGIWEYEGHQVISHSGGIHGFATDALRVPDAKLFVAVLSNYPGAPRSPGSLTLEAMALVLGKPLASRPAITLPAAKLDEVVGVYEVEGRADDVRVITREGDKLFAQRTNSPKLEIRAKREDRLFYLDRVDEIEFQRDAAGKVTGHMMIRNVGADEPAKRTERPIPADRQEIELDAATRASYVGEYQLAPTFAVVLTEEGNQLFAQATGQPRFPIFAEARDRLFFKVVDAVLEIQRGADGQVTGLILHQGGQHLPGKKVK